MLALTPFVQQLRAAGFDQVEGALELPRLDEQPRRLPALWVVPTDERAGANSLSGARDQPVDAGISVIVVVDGARRNRDGVSEELKTRIDQVVDAIAGWRHPEASRACDYAGGRLLPGGAGATTLTWEVRFTSRFRLRKAS